MAVVASHSPVEIALVGAGNRGFSAYGDVVIKHPDKVRYVAVAEPNAERREKARRRFSIPKENCFENWQEMLRRPQLASALLKATQDALHVPSTLAALRAGYAVLLEKPMALSPTDCMALAAASEKTGNLLQICHVLRFSRAFRKVKRLIERNTIGQVLHINHTESVGYWHFAHSYVRGHWRRQDESSFLLMTKSCHDLDLLCWFLGQPVQQLSSFGELSWFKAANAPAGSAPRCTNGCKVERTCPYSAIKLYLNPARPAIPPQLALGVAPSSLVHYLQNPRHSSLAGAVMDDLSEEGIQHSLRTGPYGRCVYHCDNDVVDHQTVNLRFAGGATAVFSLNAFSTLMERTTRICGSNGEIRLSDFRGLFEVRRFSRGSSRVEFIPHEAHNHGGGDEGVLLDFVKNVRSGGGQALTSARNSLLSHLLAFAAEESRLSGKTVTFPRYLKSLGLDGQLNG